ncbi:MAG: thermonuclease family protein [Elusimicrobiota bacterium]
MIITILFFLIFHTAPVFSEKLDIGKYPFVDWTVPHVIEEVKVDYVFDGDTVNTSDGRTIRLLGVNAPEVAHPTHGKPYGESGGEEARNYATKELSGKTVILVTDKENTKCVYGRILGLIFYNDKHSNQRCFNWELIKTGHGKVYIFSDDRLCVENYWDAISTVSEKKYHSITRRDSKKRRLK